MILALVIAGNGVGEGGFSIASRKLIMTNVMTNSNILNKSIVLPYSKNE